MNMLKEKMLEKNRWAVVGVNQEEGKFGNMIFRRLKTKGYEVYPINPKYHQIYGETCYPALASLPQIPEVVNIVVGPQQAKQVIREAADLGIKYIWFQPGTHNDEVTTLATELSLEYVLACVLVETSYRL